MSLRILHALRTAKLPEQASILDVLTLSVAQRELGHKVEIVTLDPVESAVDKLGIPVHRPCEGRGAYGYNPEFVTWVRTHAKDYDCVVIHGIWDYSAFGVWRALREARTPYFVFTHGHLDPWYKLHRPINHIARWLYWPWGGYPVLRDAHAVFFLSDNERHRAQEAFWLYDCHEFVVRTGVEAVSPEQGVRLADRFLKEHPSLQGKRLFAGLADQALTTKPVFFARALKQLSVRGLWDPHTMRLVIGNKVLGSQTAKEAARLGLTDSIYLTGPLDADGRWGLLAASECLLRPSLHETGSRAVGQALAMGTPVLLSSGVDAWKDIVNADAGIVGDETAEGIARMLGRWLSLDDFERARMRQAARRCFESRFTLDGAANTLTAAIYLLVGVHRDSRWDSRPLKPASEYL